MVKMQERRRLEHEGGAEKTRRANEKRAQTGAQPVGGAQVRRTLAAAVQDQKLLSISMDSATTLRNLPGIASRTIVTIK
jgi:hypothetical protein